MFYRSRFTFALPTDKKALMELIKVLRYRTEAPISDCSAALKEASGDLEEAITVLKKRGAAKAIKKGERVTAHGFVVNCVANRLEHGAALITVCSETDFAARNVHFQTTCLKVQEKMRSILEDTEGRILTNTEEALNVLSKSTEEIIRDGIAVLGENITLRSVNALRVAPHVSERIHIGAYTHGSLGSDDVGRISGLVALSDIRDSATDPIPKEILTAVARHFVATAGAEGNYAHQNFFGTEETIGKWLKNHQLKFSSSLVLEFGKEPVVHTAVLPKAK